MNAIQRKALLLILAAFTTLPLASCTEEAPTGPDKDPLVGRWLGKFISPIQGTSESNSLNITIRAGGEAVGTARFVYSYEGGLFIEELFLEFEVSPDGNVMGSGTWRFTISSVGYFVAQGAVTGQFYTEPLKGEGWLTIVEEDGTIEIPWDVLKVPSK
jgi:hypothetical protein